MIYDAYLAGFIDGDGCIHVYRRKPKTQSRPNVGVFITASNTHMGILRSLASQFGGAVSKPRIFSGHKPRAAWCKSASSKGDLLRRIRPFLLTKRKLADMCIASAQARGWNRCEVTGKILHSTATRDAAMERLYLEAKAENAQLGCPHAFYAESIAWYAGFFDAEGSVGIKNNPGTHKSRAKQIFVSVPNMCHCSVEAFKARFGGSVSHIKDGSARWHAVSRDAAKFLNAVIPYLIIKMERVELALEFQREAIGVAGRVINDQTLLYSHLCHEKMRTMNRRGTDNADYNQGRLPDDEGGPDSTP